MAASTPKNITYNFHRMDSPTTIIHDPNNSMAMCDSYTEMDEYEYSDDDISLSSNKNDNDDDDDDDSSRATSCMIPLDSTTNNNKNKKISSTVPLSPNRVLLIDELDTGGRSSAAVYYNKKKNRCSSITTNRNTAAGGKASSSCSISKATAAGRGNVCFPCPCCKAYVCQTQPQKDNLLASNPEAANDNHTSSNSLTSLVQSIFSSESKLEPELESSAKAVNKEALSSSSSIVEYTVTHTFMETWLYKKGSGRDVFGSTHWKPRWCQLVLATVPNYLMPVPLLLVSWHFSLPKPSTVILLHNKMAIAVNADTVTQSIEEEEENFPYRFDIVQCHSTENKNQSMARIFAMKNIHERDEWVYELNEAICQFEKKNKTVMRIEQMEKSKEKIGRGVVGSLPPTVPKARLERDVSAASYLEGLDLLL